MSCSKRWLALLSFLMLQGCTEFHRKQQEMANDLITTGFSWQKRDQGIRRELLPRLAHDWKIGTSRADVIGQLGAPSASIRLSGQRRIDRYYSEKLDAWAFVKPDSKPLAVRRAGYLKRELAVLELFYEKDRIVRRSQSQERFSIPGG